MEPITIIVTLIAAVLAAGLGYLFAKGQATKVKTELETNLNQSKEILVEKTGELADKESQNAQLNEKFNVLNQENIKLSTKLEHEESSHDEALDKIEALEAKLDVSNQAKHDAEKANQSAQTSVQEAINKIEDLQVRLDKEGTLTASLRIELDAEKTKIAEQGKQSKGFEVQAKKANEQLTEQNNKVEELEAKLETQRARFESLNSEHTELKTTLDERQTSHQREVETFSKQKEELKKDFENLANKIFEEKGKTFSQTSQHSIDSMLKPFREQIEGFQKRVNDVHDESVKGSTHMNSEIQKVLDIGLTMSAEANNLTSALKGDSQQRGAWGEAQLRRTLEMSGLIEEAHFEVQSSFKDNEGKQKQTDYLVKLPGNKHIIIDSKVSLIDYDRAVSAETPEAYTIAISEHVKSVKKHIDDLASKDYTNLVGMRSPDFVLMFMPIEPAYIEALKTNKDLFSYGYEKHIVLVSHTTLIPILRTVANLWVMENSNQEARELSEKAGDIFNKVCIVAENLKKLGGTLGTVSTHYNNTVKALVGQQGLHGKVERFKQLSNKVSKAMPDIEPIHNDFETERLSMIVEPILEPAIEQNNEIENQAELEAELEKESDALIEHESDTLETIHTDQELETN